MEKMDIFAAYDYGYSQLNKEIEDRTIIRVIIHQVSSRFKPLPTGNILQLKNKEWTFLSNFEGLSEICQKYGKENWEVIA